MWVDYQPDVSLYTRVFGDQRPPIEDGGTCEFYNDVGRWSTREEDHTEGDNAVQYLESSLVPGLPKLE